MEDGCSKVRLWFCSDYKRIIRICVLIICCIVVIIQLTECFLKLRFPPRATHAQYNLNETLVAPAVTICRQPGYKKDILTKYNLADVPSYQTVWEHFNFSDGNLEEFFKEATYTTEESFWEVGLGGPKEDKNTSISTTSRLHLVSGLCHTFHPLKRVKVGRDAGYSLVLSHDGDGDDDDDDGDDENKIEKGFNIYIHQEKEEFEELSVMQTGRVEHFFAVPGEKIDLKLQPTQISMLSNAERTCRSDFGYSPAKYMEQCKWDDIISKSHCSGPWLPGTPFPTCDNYESMKQHVKIYNQWTSNDRPKDCSAEQPCESNIYSLFVVNRQKVDSDDYKDYIQLRIYFTSNLVTMHQERPGYDFSQFVADLGGSLGFLLGLSVLGIIEILEKIAFLIFGECKNKADEKEDGGDDKDVNVKKADKDQEII